MKKYKIYVAVLDYWPVEIEAETADAALNKLTSMPTMKILEMTGHKRGVIEDFLPDEELSDEELKR